MKYQIEIELPDERMTTEWMLDTMQSLVYNGEFTFPDATEEEEEAIVQSVLVREREKS